MGDVQRYPLSWPAAWKRTPYGHRKRAPFSKKNRASDSGYRFKADLEVGDGLERLLGELKRLGAKGIVISSNLRLPDAGGTHDEMAMVNAARDAALKAMAVGV